MYARTTYKFDIDNKVIRARHFDVTAEQEELLVSFLSILGVIASTYLTCQRSILETDQEEEADNMINDELDEILVRSDDKAEVFCAMHIARERDALETWRAAGNRGRPPPLMRQQELPECYQPDESFEARVMDEVEVNGGGTL